jgi:hypothetical protein
LGDQKAFGPVRDLYIAHGIDDAIVSYFAPEALLTLDVGRALSFLLPWFAEAPERPGTYPHEGWNERIWRDRRQTTRLALAVTLGRHGGPEVVSKMIELLEAEDRDLRHAALVALEKAADVTAVPAVIAVIGTANEDRPLASQVLGSTGDPRAVPVLLQLLKDEAGETRSAAAAALGSIGDPAAGEALAAALQVEEWPKTKILLLEALAKLHDRRSLVAVGARLDDPDGLPQPMGINAIWGFPWNTKVADVAIWAFLSIRDGKEAIPKSAFSSFRDRTNPPALWTAEIEEAKRWLEEHRTDPAYRYE